MGFQSGVEELRPGAQRLHSKLLHSGGLAAAHPGPCYRRDGEKGRVLSSTFSKQTAPALRLAQPARTLGPRFGGAGGGGGGWRQGPESRSVTLSGCIPARSTSPAARQLESGPPCFSRPRAAGPDLATRIRQRAGRSKSHGCCSATPAPAWPLPGSPS